MEGYDTPEEQQAALAKARSFVDQCVSEIGIGTTDLTQTGEEKAFLQVAGFNEILLATLQACNENWRCAYDFGGDAIAAYDEWQENLRSLITDLHALSH